MTEPSSPTDSDDPAYLAACNRACEAALDVYRWRLFRINRITERRKAAIQAMVDLVEAVLDELARGVNPHLSSPMATAQRNAFYVETMARRVRAAAQALPRAPDGQSIEMTNREMARLLASSQIR